MLRVSRQVLRKKGWTGKIIHSLQAEEEKWMIGKGKRKNEREKNLLMFTEMECLPDKSWQNELNLSTSITPLNTGQGNMHINWK